MGKRTPVTRKDFAKIAGVAPGSITKACRPGKALEPAICSAGRRIDAAHPAAVRYVNIERGPVDPSAPDPLYDLVLEFCASRGKFVQRVVESEFKIGRPRVKRLFEAMRVAGMIPAVISSKPIVEPDPALADFAQRTGADPEPPPEAPPPPSPGPSAPAAGVRDPSPGHGSGAAPLVDFEIPPEIIEFADYTLREIVVRFGSMTQFLDVLNCVQKIETIEEKRIKTADRKAELVNRALVETGVVDPFNAAHLRLMRDGSKTITALCYARANAGVPITETEPGVVKIISAFIGPVKAQVARALREMARDG